MTAPQVIVTGATGFLGRNLVELLIKEGCQVDVLVRNQEAAQALLPAAVRMLPCSLEDITADTAGLADHYDACFHVAANTSTWARDRARQWRTNVEGTEALLGVMQNRAKRFVYVSTIAVYGVHKNEINEDSPKFGVQSPFGYVKSKTVAEQKVMEAARRGMDCVILNPTHIVGRYDDHNWARLIIKVADDDLPGIPPGGGNFASGQAVAQAIVAAWHKGKSGENYILGGPYVSFADFIHMAAKEIGRPVRSHPVPAWVLRWIAQALRPIAAITGKRPFLTPDEAYFSGERITSSSEKAVKALGYKPWTVENMIADAVAYLRAKGKLKS